MLVKTGEADTYVVKPPKTLVAALVYGPDQGLVRERADMLTKSVVPDISDAFRVAEFDGDALVSDPARLSDEAAAISMLGGRRVVRVKNAGNALADIFEEILESPIGDALIVAEAGDLAKSAALRKIFEEAKNAASIACYSDSSYGLEDLIRRALKDEGFAVAGDALSLMTSRLGSDRGVTRRELEKLVLFARGEKTITTSHVEAVMGDESELRMDEACDAAGEGDFARLDTALSRLWLSGASPVGVLRNAMGHFQRVLIMRAERDTGGDLSLAMRKLRPPIHFSREKSFQAQVSRFSRERVEEALGFLYEAEALVKTTAVPSEAACGRAFFSVAALSRAAR